MVSQTSIPTSALNSWSREDDHDVNTQHQSAADEKKPQR